ncbi:acVLRF1 family peptidyl-tRNA hydrolase [Aquipuribacter sp. SD81]|uniref:acVLRF1 family peptidyl-tRNA hydrolase n=1 Tax=Aquipuribacter sp. SD81 TaxID=3127703 RepID=UPI003018A091
MTASPAASRFLEVAPGRVVGWVGRYVAARDGAVTARAVEDGLLLTPAEGGSALLRLLRPDGWASSSGAVDASAVAAHLASAASVSVPLLVVAARRGGYGVAVVRDGRVLAAKVGRRYVQGSTAAGGWSQQRFARRRGNQADKLARDAGDVLRGVLAAALPVAPVGVAVAGDRGLVDGVLDASPAADLPRLGPLEVGEPRRADLDELALRVLAVRVTVHDA